MTDEKELLEKFKEEIQIVRTNNNEREGYIINSGSLKAICITPMRNYGGGTRTLWAIEGVEAQITVNRAYPYIHGICLKILFHPGCCAASSNPVNSIQILCFVVFATSHKSLKAFIDQ